MVLLIVPGKFRQTVNGVDKTAAVSTSVDIAARFSSSHATRDSLVLLKDDARQTRFSPTRGVGTYTTHEG
jgi:hypothetical protein